MLDKLLTMLYFNWNRMYFYCKCANMETVVLFTVYENQHKINLDENDNSYNVILYTRYDNDLKKGSERKHLKLLLI